MSLPHGAMNADSIPGDIKAQRLVMLVGSLVPICLAGGKEGFKYPSGLGSSCQLPRLGGGEGSGFLS